MHKINHEDNYTQCVIVWQSVFPLSPLLATPRSTSTVGRLYWLLRFLLRHRKLCKLKCTLNENQLHISLCLRKFIILGPVEGVTPSILPGMSLCSCLVSAVGIGERFTIGPHVKAPYQNWCIEGRAIRNKMYPTECLEIRRGDFRDGADVILHRYESEPWQHWRLEYI